MQRAPTFKTIGVERRAEPPTEPRVNTEIRCPTRAAKLEPKHVLVAIQCRPVRQEHATGGNSMQDHPARVSSMFPQLYVPSALCSLKSSNMSYHVMSSHVKVTSGKAMV